MIFAIITFGVVFAIISGIYWIAVVRPERDSKATLLRRISAQSVGVSKAVNILRAAAPRQVPEAVDRFLAGRREIAGPLQQLIDESGSATTPGGLALLMAGTALIGSLVAWRLTGLLFASFVAALVAGAVPYLWTRRKRTVRQRALEEQFPDAIDLIARALRAGHAFSTGLSMAAEEMPKPLGEELKLLFDRHNYGMPMPDAMREFARRVPSLDVRFFVTAVLTQRESGGNLAEVLDNLAGVIRERFKVKRQIRVVTTHGRMTGWILASLPPVLAMVMFAISPQTYQLLFTDPLGVRMVLIALGLQLVGTLAIRKIVDVEY